MRNTNTCPKCESTAIWAIEQVNQPSSRSSQSVKKMVVTSGMVPPAKEGFFEIAECVEAGNFELRVCARCGYTEWYAADANRMLAKLAKAPGMGVRLIELDDTHRGPFR